MRKEPELEIFPEPESEPCSEKQTEVHDLERKYVSKILDGSKMNKSKIRN
jgi:hypothetical protein